VVEQAAVVVRIGTCGWSHDHWQPELYAPGLPAAARLARYAASCPTAELNSSFYRWPRPSAFRNWRRKLPDGFRLSVKAPRGLTHGRRLHAPETWLQRIGAGWHELGGPCSSGVSGDAQDVHPPGLDLHHEQDIQASEEHGVSVQEVA
jgi:uncharacterized protein YecE (DUF72 family)